MTMKIKTLGSFDEQTYQQLSKFINDKNGKCKLFLLFLRKVTVLLSTLFISALSIKSVTSYEIENLKSVLFLIGKN